MSSGTPSEAGAPDLVLRPAEDADAGEVAATFTAARTAAARLGHMPAPLHTAEEDLRHFAGVIADASKETWVAERGGQVVGFVVMTPTWVNDLFVHPDHQRLGVGSALLDLAMSLRPDGFGLHVFEVNRPARALYEARGLAVTGRSAGENEERAPDLRMEWPGAR